MLESPYKKFTGITPTTEDFSSWDSAKWMDYLRFMDFHIEQVKKPKYPLRDGYVITKEKIDKIREWQSQSDHPWLEFIYRISNDDKTKYMSKIRTANAKAMLFLQIRPTLITNDMRLLMQKNEFLMGKYLRVNPIIVAPDIMPSTEVKEISPQVKLLSNTMDIVQTVIDRIKKEGVDRMTVKELISALPKFVDAINKMQGKANKINNLTLINTQGSVEDMEKDMLGMLGK